MPLPGSPFRGSLHRSVVTFQLSEERMTMTFQHLPRWSSDPGTYSIDYKSLSSDSALLS